MGHGGRRTSHEKVHGCGRKYILQTVKHDETGDPQETIGSA
jgi:hypothetical protein